MSFAKLYRAGWQLADELERNRRAARPETYRGAFADLCMRLDNSPTKSVPFNPRYWAKEWCWHDQEITRFFRRLDAAGVIKIKAAGNVRTIVASKNNVSRVVSKTGNKCEQQSRPTQGENNKVVSLRPDECEQNVSIVPTTGLNLSANADSSSAAPNDTCPHQEIVRLYHEVLPELPKVVKWTPARQKLLRARWREDQKRQSIDAWRKFFEFVKKSDFLMGRAGSFQANLEWLLRPSNFVKILERQYHRQQDQQPPPTAGASAAEETRKKYLSGGGV
ncbi:MAG: hypothetical protein OEV73_00365 [Desulfobulbaceae bacterium]|nr:hypothetical protein [Desulfobulbaceae bacterium]